MIKSEIDLNRKFLRIYNWASKSLRVIALVFFAPACSTYTNPGVQTQICFHFYEVDGQAVTIAPSQMTLLRFQDSRVSFYPIGRRLPDLVWEVPLDARCAVDFETFRACEAASFFKGYPEQTALLVVDGFYPVDLSFLLLREDLCFLDCFSRHDSVNKTDVYTVLIPLVPNTIEAPRAQYVENPPNYYDGYAAIVQHKKRIVPLLNFKKHFFDDAVEAKLADYGLWKPIYSRGVICVNPLPLNAYFTYLGEKQIAFNLAFPTVPTSSQENDGMK